jgi:hypothetical protein
LFFEALLRDAKPFHGFASNRFGLEADMLNLNAAKGEGRVREDAENVENVMHDICWISATDSVEGRNRGNMGWNGKQHEASHPSPNKVVYVKHVKKPSLCKSKQV